MSEAGSLWDVGPEPAGPRVRVSLERASSEGVCMCRLAGAVRLLDALHCETGLSPTEHRFYRMAWQVTRLLKPRPADAAGWPSPVLMP